MPEATTAAAKANKAKHAASPLGLPTDEMPKFGLPKMQVLVALREFADTGVVQAKENCQKIQSATKDMTALLEQTYSTAAKGGADYNLKLIEMARINSNAALEFACGLIAMKSLPEMVKLSTEQARKQFDLVTAQNKGLWALAETMAAKTIEPIKQSVAKTFKR